MGVSIDMGEDGSARVGIDLEELLATRLLVQGNSGSGKSHLLRRLLEGSASQVQQIVIDPEGDFVSLADAFGHVDRLPVRQRDELRARAARLRPHLADSHLDRPARDGGAEGEELAALEVADHLGLAALHAE